MVASVGNYMIDGKEYTPKYTIGVQSNNNLFASGSSNATSSGDSYGVSGGETCTDGKDDGKIGFFSAAGNFIKGAGKTILNGVKGMFTGKDGKFSLGKTLLSVGTAALCIGVPAVGLAACAVGGVMGAVQIGKGAVKAANAKTDAEAKNAWQDIGGGSLTVAASVVGGKASLNAMKASSTAGLEAAGKGLHGAELQEAMAQQGSSALENAHGLGKVSALFKDAASSTRNNAVSIADAVKPTITNFKQNRSDYAEIKTLMEKDVSTLTDAEKARLSELQNNDWAVNKYANKNTPITNKVKNAGKNAFEATKNAGKNAVKITKETAPKIIEGIKNSKSLAKNIPSKLSAGAKNVWNAIHSTDASYAQLVQQYGYENVAEVIKVVGGYEIASNEI